MAKLPRRQYTSNSTSRLLNVWQVSSAEHCAVFKEIIPKEEMDRVAWMIVLDCSQPHLVKEEFDKWIQVIVKTQQDLLARCDAKLQGELKDKGFIFIFILTFFFKERRNVKMFFFFFFPFPNISNFFFFDIVHLTLRIKKYPKHHQTNVMHWKVFFKLLFVFSIFLKSLKKIIKRINLIDFFLITTLFEKKNTEKGGKLWLADVGINRSNPSVNIGAPLIVVLNKVDMMKSLFPAEAQANSQYEILTQYVRLWCLDYAASSFSMSKGLKEQGKRIASYLEHRIFGTAFNRGPSAVVSLTNLKDEFLFIPSGFDSKQILENQANTRSLTDPFDKYFPLAKSQSKSAKKKFVPQANADSTFLKEMSWALDNAKNKDSSMRSSSESTEDSTISAEDKKKKDTAAVKCKPSYIFCSFVDFLFCFVLLLFDTRLYVFCSGLVVGCGVNAFAFLGSKILYQIVGKFYHLRKRSMEAPFFKLIYHSIISQNKKRPKKKTTMKANKHATEGTFFFFCVYGIVLFNCFLSFPSVAVNKNCTGGKFETKTKYKREQKENYINIYFCFIVFAFDYNCKIAYDDKQFIITVMKDMFMFTTKLTKKLSAKQTILQ
ncbi:dynein light intermediate chain [Reticulomyxa filosa]|uniref:Dynein light intermediate chain n=1 Tax=Reticulomyxa filosa TaxID=46433 RepID=X6MA80_RETFI|nr:dynein light intermediate chain [Reticulomyxa filosa]|eukprot:ETO09920.1 dynein light intermediate chain [Reticulomyxa filosa]